MTAYLEICESGLQTTVQDGGFRGLRHQAISQCGAADPLSLALANIALGHHVGKSGLEITLAQEMANGFAMRYHCDETDITLRCAIAGAPCPVTFNGAAMKTNRAFTLKNGDNIQWGAPPFGCRSYFALSADFDLPMVMNSHSTHIAGGFGGYKGRALQKGDKITLKPSKAIANIQGDDQLPVHMASMTIAPWITNHHHILHIIDAPESTIFAAETDALCTQKWSVSGRAGRMGIMLTPANPPLEDTHTHAPHNTHIMKSGPVFPGTIQFPPHGHPFILGVDGQTTGGYPRIGRVIRADRHILGQLRPGDTVEFRAISTDIAKQKWQQKIYGWSSLCAPEILQKIW